MKNLLTSATLLLTAAMLSANVSAQFPQGAQPSPEQMQAMQEQMMKMMKPLIEEAFDNSDADDSDSLDKDEMLEFSVEMFKAQRKLMAEQGMPVPELSEAELNQMKEEGKEELDEAFKEADADESGDISQEEVFKVIFGDVYSGEEEEEEPESTSDDDANGSEDSKESASDAY
ncbi:MAG: hypothetical protein F4X44_12395 [Gammaproteobacteria bacterium]|nr:hypothetical protein [Gammaproteobacteria bacterium]